jgi:hypothetical protein
MNVGNACYFSVPNLLSSHPLFKDLTIMKYKAIILPVVLYGCETTVEKCCHVPSQTQDQSM